MNKAFLIKTMALAETRRGFCAPNPCVGAIIVKNNQLIAEGVHIARGQAHAEVVAIQKAGSNAENSTLYVSLEPCSHTGLTPPCVDAIIRAKIKKVFFAYRDPNPKVRGKGQSLLQKAGIDCKHIPVKEIDKFYVSYHHWTLKKKPWVSVKLALSADKKIGFTDKPTALTGQPANALTHQLRRRSDAILTTIKTVLTDNPQLNARNPPESLAKNVYVLDRQLQLPADARLLTSTKRLTLLHSANASVEEKPWLEQPPVKRIAIPCENQHLSLEAAIAAIGEAGVHDLWVEVGSQCFNALIKQRLVNELYLYITPKVLGKTAITAFESLTDIKAQFAHSTWEVLGKDVLLHLWNDFIDSQHHHC